MDNYKGFRASLEDKEIEKVGNLIRNNFYYLYCISYVKQKDYDRHVIIGDRTRPLRRSIDKCFVRESLALKYLNEHRGLDPKLLNIETFGDDYNYTIKKQLKKKGFY